MYNLKGIVLQSSFAFSAVEKRTVVQSQTARQTGVSQRPGQLTRTEPPTSAAAHDMENFFQKVFV